MQSKQFISTSWDTHIAAPNKQQTAYQTLKTAIVTLDLPPNTMLVERYVMDRFGLSRTPMREAINRLQTEGFLTNVANKGFMVNDIQYKDFMALYEIKEALESEAAYLCCTRKTPAVLDRIEAAHQTYEDSLSAGKHIHSMILDLEFHWSIVVGANNLLLERQMSLVMDQSLKFFNMYYNDATPLRTASLFGHQHRIMLDTIRGDDPNAARRAVIDHIQSVKQAARDDLF